MLISEKTTGSIIYLFFLRQKKCSLVRQLEKIMVEKSTSKSSKMCEKPILGPYRNPPVT